MNQNCYWLTSELFIQPPPDRQKKHDHGWQKRK